MVQTEALKQAVQSEKDSQAAQRGAGAKSSGEAQKSPVLAQAAGQTGLSSATMAMVRAESNLGTGSIMGS